MPCANFPSDPGGGLLDLLDRLVVESVVEDFEHFVDFFARLAERMFSRVTRRNPYMAAQRLDRRAIQACFEHFRGGTFARLSFDNVGRNRIAGLGDFFGVSMRTRFRIDDKRSRHVRILRPPARYELIDTNAAADAPPSSSWLSLRITMTATVIDANVKTNITVASALSAGVEVPLVDE